MEHQKRTIMIVLILVVVGVVASSFTLARFIQMPRVSLPEVSPAQVSSGQSDNPAGTEDFIRVEVNPQTVQKVVASMERAESYFRTLTVEYIWEGGSSSATVKTWVDDGVTRMDWERSGSPVRHVILTAGRAYIWYDGTRTWYEGSRGDFTADGDQHIPTYEDIAALDTGDILAADYTELNGMSCIYAETKEDDLGYVRKYWVDVRTGLLVQAEQAKNGTLFYRMSAGDVSGVNFSGEVFSLPDGTAVPQA